ncbi:hypothetical protein COM03_20900, partial [Bacillus wiedmannii]|uniref:RNA-directed DNA polymerase n=1 Tax=Bacillus wiedmannii TaxID=1890302 RepID=UPI000C006953
MDVRDLLILNGFIPKELPCEFVAKNLHKIDLGVLGSGELKKWSKLIEFSIPKNDSFRRVCSIVHPLHFVQLANEIKNEWSNLETYFRNSNVSLTTPIIEGNGIVSKYSMSETTQIRLSNLSSKKYILKVDINRYYPSIYTHSIPWALHGKKIAKDKMRDQSLLGNKLDTLIRNMQDGQTIGIPIGPQSSFIIQEIIGTAIDMQFKNAMGKEVKGYRYTDDMEYYFDSHEEANHALTVMNQVLKNYELDLNVEKTKIIKLPQLIEPDWLFYFKKFKFRKSNKPEEHIKLQLVDLKEYFNKIFYYKDLTNDVGISNFALKCLGKVVIKQENWGLFESLLLQTILIDSRAIPKVFEIMEAYKYRGYPLNLDKISESVNSIIKEHIQLRGDYEVIWALSLANKFKLNITEDVTSLLLNNNNALINILVMVLKDKGQLLGDKDFSFYEEILSDNDLYGKSWIFLYECCKNGWLNKDSKILKRDKFFNILLKNHVSFIDSNYSVVKSKINIQIVNLCMENISGLEINKVYKSILDKYSYNLEEEHEQELFKELIDLLKLKISEQNLFDANLIRNPEEV